MIRIVVVGPHVSSSTDNASEVASVEPCGTCFKFPPSGGKDAPLVVECWRGLYQDWLDAAKQAGKTELKPDIAFMMNCGICDAANTNIFRGNAGVRPFL
jgi:hypothetical protein